MNSLYVFSISVAKGPDCQVFSAIGSIYATAFYMFESLLKNPRYGFRKSVQIVSAGLRIHIIFAQIRRNASIDRWKQTKNYKT